MKRFLALLFTTLIVPAFADPVDSVPVRLVAPLYPAAAIDKGLEGTVVVCFGIDADGHAVDPIVLSSTSEIFNQPALKAVANSVFAARVPGGLETCWRYRFRL